MTIAVVILNWNGRQLLEQFLPSVIRHSDGAAIYVADNASTDDSIAFVTEKYPSVEIISNVGNFGYAKGYNEALQFVEEDIYALVNSDIEVGSNWLQPILSMFESEPDTAIIQPKILDYKNKAYFEYAGAAGGFIDKYGYPYCRGRIFDTVEKDIGQYNDEAEIFWASGACFFIRKAVFRELGGFDSDFFAHQEEIDLCWRSFNKNYKVKYCPNSTVYHVGGATLNSSNPHKTYLNFRNSLSMILKNAPNRGLYITLFTRLIIDGLAGVNFLAKGKVKHCFAIIRAHFAFYSSFRKNYSKRQAANAGKYYTIDSVAYEYFVRKIRYYKSLI
jgi:GT2 family glycosyltransferase